MGLFVANAVCAQSVRDVWKSMPDSLLNSLDKSKRLELLDFFDMNVKETVDNRLGGHASLDTMTNSYMKVRMSDCSEVEIKLYSCHAAGFAATADSVICMIQTFSAPQPESRVRLFTREWMLLGDTCFTAKTLMVRPDTMPEATYQELLRQIPLVLWKAEAQIEENDEGELMLTPSLPLTFVEKREQFLPLIMQRKIKLKDILLK